MPGGRVSVWMCRCTCSNRTDGPSTHIRSRPPRPPSLDKWGNSGQNEPRATTCRRLTLFRDAYIRRLILHFLRSRAAVCFRPLGLPLCEIVLSTGLVGLAMLFKELSGILMQLGRLVVNLGCMLMGSNMPTLTLLVLVFGHNPRHSHDIATRPRHTLAGKRMSGRGICTG
jgi:hypothetical protein